MSTRFIKEFVPRSWFHPKGVYKVVERLKDRLPNVNGSLFATFTLDRTYFQMNEIGPSEAFDLSRSHIRKVFYKLRKGIKWEDKLYKIQSPYCTKVEFHDDEEGWPHFHIIWLTKRFIPAELIASLWGYGRTNVKRITNTEFNYLLKDGSIRVSIKHEVALDPGIIVLDRLIDPSLSTETRLDGDEVKSFPELKKFEQVIVRVQKIKEFNNQMSASDWEISRN